MTELKQAAQQALEALESASGNINPERGYVDELENEVTAATKALRTALAQPEQEPVCDKDPQGCWNVRCQLGKKCKNTLKTRIGGAILRSSPFTASTRTAPRLKQKPTRKTKGRTTCTPCTG